VQESEDELLKERDCVGHLIPGATRAVCEIVEDTMLPGELAGGHEGALGVWWVRGVFYIKYKGADCSLQCVPLDMCCAACPPLCPAGEN
jgi:hypothetical protein